MKQHLVRFSGLAVFLSLTIFLAGAAQAAQQDFCEDLVSLEPNERPEQEQDFLSSSEPAYAYLEGLQNWTYSRNPELRQSLADLTNPGAFEGLISELGEQLGFDDDEDQEFTKTLSNQLNRQMPTRFENPSTMFLLCALALDVHGEFEANGLGLEMPYLGTLGSGTLNAQARGIPGSERQLVTVNFALYTFAHELGKIGLSTIPIEAEGEFIAIDTSNEYLEEVRGDLDFLVRFSKALEDFSNLRPVRGQAPPRRFDAPLLIAMTSALEQFVVAHEFAHIHLQHTARRRHTGDTLSSRAELNDAELLRSWKEEAAADLFAALILQRMTQRDAASAEGIRPLLGEYLRYAPIFFFQLNEIAEESKFIFENGAEPPQLTGEERQEVIEFLANALASEAQTLDTQVSAPPVEVPPIVRQFGTHPPAWARRALLSAIWSSTAPTSLSETEAEFGKVAILMGSNLETLWGDLKPAWIEISKTVDRSESEQQSTSSR